jgi:hypothetical protein
MTTNNKHIDDQFQTLLETVERLRHTKFAHLDADLVRNILRLHADGAADTDVVREVESEVEKLIARGV